MSQDFGVAFRRTMKKAQILHEKNIFLLKPKLPFLLLFVPRVCFQKKENPSYLFLVLTN